MQAQNGWLNIVQPDGAIVFGYHDHRGKLRDRNHWELPKGSSEQGPVSNEDLAWIERQLSVRTE